MRCLTFGLDNALGKRRRSCATLVDSQHAGCIVIPDEVKEDSKRALASHKSRGVAVPAFLASIIPFANKKETMSFPLQNALTKLICCIMLYVSYLTYLEVRNES